MSRTDANRYTPDTVSAPGETLSEVLDARGMSQAELADRTGRPRKTINEIVKGRASITPETALQLERVLGIPAHFWLNREQHYREHLSKLAEHQHLQEHLAWLDMFPVTAMAKLGWITRFQNQVAQIQEVLNFFGVASPERWNERWCSPRIAYRKSKAFENKPGPVAAWLRKGELVAQQIQCGQYDSDRLMEALNSIRNMTARPPDDFCHAMETECARAGVALAVVHELPGAPVSGATHWLGPDKALVQLTIRYKTDDHLWFSFFHEAGHILLHGKKDVFIEAKGVDSQQERQADTFASNLLIPPSEFVRFVKANRFSASSIRSYALELGIAPGIVVGRLQHEGLLGYKDCNQLKRRLQWTDD